MTAAPSAPRPRILLVDDEAVVLEVLEAAFSKRGWQVDRAQSVEQALARFADGKPEVVLTDKNLPGATGVDLVARLRETDVTVGLVVMTAYGSVESATDTLNLGVDEYLEKPFLDLFAVVDAMAALRERVLDRRSGFALEIVVTMTLVLASTGERAGRIERLLAAGGDRVLVVGRPAELAARTRESRADAVIVDARAFPQYANGLVAELRTHARAAHCLVLSEELSLADVMRLIKLEVKALVEDPLDAPTFAPKLSAAVERLRRTRAAR